MAGYARLRSEESRRGRQECLRHGEKSRLLVVDRAQRPI
jgi:hypothetical protein